MADRLVGCLLGTAVGDSLGLPREGLSRERAIRLFGASPIRHRFILGRGMISDDAEHATLVAQALLASGGEPQRFARSLARQLRLWLICAPAGVGLATLRAALKLLLGVSPERSGIYSAGNGPAMRAPIIGAFAHREESLLRELNRMSTRITHTDLRAEEGALLIALAVRHGVLHGSSDVRSFMETALPHVKDNQLIEYLNVAKEHVLHGADAGEFAKALGLEKGVTGFMNHTVPATLFCWLRYGTDFRRAVEEIILLGGDTDTTGAIVGGLMGATLGASAIPEEWISGIVDRPRSPVWMRRLGKQLCLAITDPCTRPLPLSWPMIPLRNLIFTLIVLAHGLRRLLPPY